jgi:hypothetical protein
VAVHVRNVLNDPDHKVNLLQRAFVNYYIADNGCLPTAATKVSSQLSRVYFSPSLVRRAIKRLKVKTKGDGGWGDTSPTGLKHRGLGRSLYVKTANFFGASRRLLFN